MEADRYVPGDRTLIPCADERPVDHSPFDFRNLKLLSEGFQSEVIRKMNGYDHSFVLYGDSIELRGDNGVRLQVKTDCRAVQIYTANYLTDRAGKRGTRYHPHEAICMETESRQLYRNRPIPEESLLSPNQVKTHVTEFRFIFE